MTSRPTSFPLIYRFSAEDYVEDGVTLEEPMERFADRTVSSERNPPLTLFYQSLLFS